MTNEELVIKIQDGETDLILNLWEQVEKLIRGKAIEQYNKMKGTDGNEIDDFIQQGYFAFVYAIEHFERNCGYKFTTYIDAPLKTAFAELSGYRTQKRNPLNNCISLDIPLDDSGDSDTLLSFIEEPGNRIEDLERKIWREQLKETILKAMEALPDGQRAIIEDRYYKLKTAAEISQERDISQDKIRQEENKALDLLYRERKKTGIEEFVDSQTNYYMKSSIQQYNSTGTSVTERIVIKREYLRTKFLTEEKELIENE